MSHPSFLVFQKRKTWFALFFGFILYFFAAKLGLELASINKQASPVWPATGIAMGLCLIFGPELILSVFLGAFFSNLSTGLDGSIAALIAIGNSLEALLFIYAFNRVIKNKNQFGVHTRAILTVFIMIFAAMVSATVGTMALYSASIVPAKMIPNNWATWWIGDFLGALFLVPIAYKIKELGWKVLQLSFGKLIQLLFLFAATLLICDFIFRTNLGQPFLFLIFSVLLVAAVYFSSFWLYCACFIIGAISVWETSMGLGPFAGAHLNERLLNLQIFLSALCLTSIGLGSIKLEGLKSKVIIALGFGWTLSGLAFYISYTSNVHKDEIRFQSLISQVKESIEFRMNDYVQALESGVSFINASSYVSEKEWQHFAKQLLATNHYPGIEGLGVIFSDQISNRFPSKVSKTIAYRHKSPFHSVPDLTAQTKTPDSVENFIITYIEPFAPNQQARGLNISSEKNRYEAAIESRDSGKAKITNEIRLVQDKSFRVGALILSPIYASDEVPQSVSERRKAHIGFVYAPVIIEELLSKAEKRLGRELNLKIFSKTKQNQVIFTSGESKTSHLKSNSQIVLADKVYDVEWTPGANFESTTSSTSMWVSFFGTLLALFLGILLSSLEGVTARAQQMAQSMTSELSERKRAWQVLTETSPVGIYTTDEKGLCTYVNPAWSKMTGLSLNEALGFGWIQALHPDDRDLVTKNWANLNDEKEFDFNYRLVHKNNNVVLVAGKAVALKSEQGKIEGYMATAQDITELQNHQIALSNSSRMSSLGQMASGVAHEINTPLAVIQGRAYHMEMLLSKEAPASLGLVKKDLYLISSTVQKIAKIIKGLRAFARETSAEPSQKVSVLETLNETLELCKEKLSHHKVQLIVPDQVPDDLFYWGRSEQISQVLLNLLNNAFDAVYRTNDPWIKIEIKANDKQIHFAVSDSGPGIDPDIKSRLFHPFFTTKEIGKGTGLGLSISRGMIERHQGQLILDETQTHTTFTFYIPRMISEARVA